MSAAAGGGSAAAAIPSPDLFTSTLPEGSLLRTFNINELADFKQFVREQADKLGYSPNEPIAPLGGIILQGFIRTKFRQKIEQNEHMYKRLEYFNSPEFLTNFITDVPSRQSFPDSRDNYRLWFNTLFNSKFDKWRKRMNRSADQTQCKRTLREEARPECHLCGVNIDSAQGHATKQCEHILPILSGISHLSLINEKMNRYTRNQQAILKLEYGWSHWCCNIIKSNVDFVITDMTNLSYIVNYPLIREYYERLTTEIGIVNQRGERSGKSDCSKITLDTRLGRARAKFVLRLKTIVAIINNNINKLGDIELYHLLIKFKILSAFSDEDFINSLKGDDTDAISLYSSDSADDNQRHSELSDDLESIEEEEDAQLLEQRRIAEQETLKETLRVKQREEERIRAEIRAAEEYRRLQRIYEEDNRARNAREARERQAREELRRERTERDRIEQERTQRLQAEIQSRRQRNLDGAIQESTANWQRNGFFTALYNQLPPYIKSLINRVSGGNLVGHLTGGQRGGGGEDGMNSREEESAAAGGGGSAAAAAASASQEPNGMEPPDEDQYFQTYLQPLQLPRAFLRKIGYTEQEISFFTERKYIGSNELNTKLIPYILTQYTITRDSFQILLREFVANSVKDYTEYRQNARKEDMELNKTDIIFIEDSTISYTNTPRVVKSLLKNKLVAHTLKFNKKYSKNLKSLQSLKTSIRTHARPSFLTGGKRRTRREKEKGKQRTRRH